MQNSGENFRRAKSDTTFVVPAGSVRQSETARAEIALLALARLLARREARRLQADGGTSPAVPVSGAEVAA